MLSRKDKRRDFDRKYGSYVDRFIVKLEDSGRGLEWFSMRDILGEFFEFLKLEVDMVRKDK